MLVRASPTNAHRNLDVIHCALLIHHRCTGRSTLATALQHALCGAYLTVTWEEPTYKSSSPEVRQRTGPCAVVVCRLPLLVMVTDLLLPTPQDIAEARLVARFSQQLHALRIASTHQSGVLLDGCLAGEVARVEADIISGRLASPRASNILRLGDAAPPPN